MTSKEWVTKFGLNLQQHYGKPFTFNEYTIYGKTLKIYAIPGDVYIIKNIIYALWKLYDKVEPDCIILLLGNRNQFVCFTYSHISFIKSCNDMDEFQTAFLKRDRMSLIGMYFDYTMREFYDWMTSFERKNFCCIPKKYLKTVQNQPYIQSENIKPVSTKKVLFRRKNIIL